MSRARYWIPVLVLLAGCGGVIALSPEHPLGELEEIDTYLVGERQFKKSQDDFRHSDCFDDEDLLDRFRDMKVFEYLEVGKGTVAGEIHVKVVLDDSGNVVALVGRFHSRTARWSNAGGKTETFFAEIWKAVSGSEAIFTKECRPGPMDETYLHSEFDRGTVAGRWDKEPTTGNAEHTRTLWDRVFIYVK